MDIKDIYDIDAIKQSLSGKSLIMRKLYLLEKPLLAEEIIRRTRLASELRSKHSKQKEKFYLEQQQIIESKGIKEIYMLPYFSSSYTIAGTDIVTPLLCDLVDCHFNGLYYKYEISTKFNSTRVYYFSEKSCFSNLTETKVISFQHEDRKATTEEIDSYVKILSDEQNFLYLITKISSLLESCKFNRYYDIPPYLPEEIHCFFEERRKIPPSSTVINEHSNIYSTNSQIILDIKKQLRFLSSASQEYYENELSRILNDANSLTTDLSIFDGEYNRQFMLREKLINLQAEIELPKTHYRPELLRMYLEKLDCVSSQSQDNEKQIEDIFFAINYFEANKEDESFQAYQQTQDKIADILVNTLVNQPTSQDKIIPQLTELYQSAVYLKLRGRLEQYISQSQGDDVLLTAYSLLLNDSIDEGEFITKSLQILSADVVGNEKKR